MSVAKYAPGHAYFESIRSMLSAERVITEESRMNLGWQARKKSITDSCVWQYEPDGSVAQRALSTPWGRHECCTPYNPFLVKMIFLFLYLLQNLGQFHTPYDLAPGENLFLPAPLEEVTLFRCLCSLSLSDQAVSFFDLAESFLRMLKMSIA